MKSPNILAWRSVAFLAALCACATARGGIPTVRFAQYAMQPGPALTHAHADIEITVRVLRITDIYDYPELFAFRQQEIGYPDDRYLKQNYPPDATGRQWEYWFASPDGSEQLLICWVTIKNGTDHILRMRDARIYLVAEGREPLAALGSFETLFERADRFWQMNVRQAEERGGLFRLIPPEGFARAALRGKRDAFRLVNDVGREILPGFTFDGMLAFPVVPTSHGPVTISFFDITTRTDAAGNPVEKTRFDFALAPQTVQMWYDAAEARWKLGAPPREP